MIDFSKGYTTIGSTTIYINVYVELDNIDYMPVLGCNIDINTLANKALQESGIFYKAFPCLLKVCSFDRVEVYSDDTIDYETIEDFISHRTSSPMLSTIIEDKSYVKFNDKEYKCLIKLFK